MSNVVRFPQTIETLWWPDNILGRGISWDAKFSPDDWVYDLMNGSKRELFAERRLRVGDVVEFLVEDVKERFVLEVYEDGSYRTDPDIIHPHVDLYISTDEGHCAKTLDGILAQVSPHGFYRLHCRISAISEIPMRLHNNLTFKALNVH